MTALLLSLALVAATPHPAAQAGSAPLEEDREEDGSLGEDSGELEELVAAEEASEQDALRALEEATLDASARPSAEVLSAMRRLGLANPLRQRMADAFGEAELREDPFPGELPPVTDLASFDVSVVQHQYDIPMEMQPLVARYIQFFQGPGRKWFRKWVGRSTRFIPLMVPILEEHGLPRDTVYLAMIESGFSPQAYSWAKAAGPWQFIPSTGKMYGLEQDFWRDERRDFVKSTGAAARFLRQLHGNLGHWYLAWAGYNTGGGRVRRAIARRNTRDFWELIDGRGLAKETRHYVPKLLAAALVSKNLPAFGFSEDEFEYQEPLEWDEVLLEHAVDLEVLARAAGSPLERLVELNPELRRWCTPPASAKSPYALRVPRGRGAAVTLALAELPAEERLTFRVHRVRRGDTLSAISQRYRSAPEAIMDLNELQSARTLRVGAELVIPLPHAPGGGAEDPVLSKQVARARQGGISTHRPEDEIPAGTPSRGIAGGPIKTEVIGGRTQVTYGVQSGDSLWAIGQRFNCSVEALRRWNGLSRKDRLQIGAVLTLWPGPGAKPAEVTTRQGTVLAQRAPPPRQASAGQVHHLRAGESLWTVAQRYGVSVEDLQRWNEIVDPARLQIGQALAVTSP